MTDLPWAVRASKSKIRLEFVTRCFAYKRKATPAPKLPMKSQISRRVSEGGFWLLGARFAPRCLLAWLWLHQLNVPLLADSDRLLVKPKNIFKQINTNSEKTNTKLYKTISKKIILRYTFFEFTCCRLSCQATATAARKLTPWWNEIGDKSSRSWCFTTRGFPTTQLACSLKKEKKRKLKIKKTTPVYFIVMMKLIENTNLSFVARTACHKADNEAIILGRWLRAVRRAFANCSVIAVLSFDMIRSCT